MNLYEAWQKIKREYWHRTELPKPTKVETIKAIIDKSGGHICSVVFVKVSTGKVRKMNFRRHVTKGVNGKGLRYKPESKGNMIVWEMKSDGKKCWKTIKLKNVMSLNANGKSYNWSK